MYSLRAQTPRAKIIVTVFRNLERTNGKQKMTRDVEAFTRIEGVLVEAETAEQRLIIRMVHEPRE